MLEPVNGACLMGMAHLVKIAGNPRTWEGARAGYNSGEDQTA